MSGLVLKLGPQERILVNGAVIENGNRRSSLNILTPKANILRLRDAIHPENADTPVKRVCYVLQLILSGDLALSQASFQVSRGLEELKLAFIDSESFCKLEDVSTHFESGNVYQALKVLRGFIKLEESLLAGPHA